MLEFLPIIGSIIVNASVFPKRRRSLHLVAAIGCGLMTIYSVIIGDQGLVIGNGLSTAVQVVSFIRFFKD